MLATPLGWAARNLRTVKGPEQAFVTEAGHCSFDQGVHRVRRERLEISLSTWQGMENMQLDSRLSHMYALQGANELPPDILAAMPSDVPPDFFQLPPEFSESVILAYTSGTASGKGVLFCLVWPHSSCSCTPQCMQSADTGVHHVRHGMTLASAA